MFHMFNAPISNVAPSLRNTKSRARGAPYPFSVLRDFLLSWYPPPSLSLLVVVDTFDQHIHRNHSSRSSRAVNNPNMATVGVPDQLYATAFSGRDPKEATQLLQQRFRDATSLFDELGEYLLKRAELDHNHAQALNQLAEDTFFSYNGVPTGFRPILDALASELTTESQYYSSRSDVSEQCEKVLRDAPDQGSWAQLPPSEDKLHDMARDLNLLEASMARERRKLGSESEHIRYLASQRVGQLQRDLGRAIEAWRADAGPIFGLAQKADRERLVVLKDCVGRFHSGTRTLAHDLSQTAEHILGLVSVFNVDEELHRFAQTPSKDHFASVPHLSPASTTNASSRSTPLTSVQAPNGNTPPCHHVPGKPLPPSEA